MPYLTRALEKFVAVVANERPIIYLNGPRQVGKSTLADHLPMPARYLSFDSPLLLTAAKTDPANFLSGLSADQLTVIDEAQLAPEIFRHLKIAVDNGRRQGRAAGLFLLTGSANLLALPRLSEALVGRMAVLTLLPLSAAEYRQTGVNFLEKLWSEKPTYRRGGDYDLLDIIGGATFPELATHPRLNREKWFDDYLTTLLQRDLQTVAEIRHPGKIVDLLTLLTTRVGAPLTDSHVYAELGLRNTTYDNYKAAITNTFVVFTVPAWAKATRVNKRLTKAAKLYFNDTNLLVYLMRRDWREIYRHDRVTLGHLFENFIATEIMKNCSPLTGVTVSHFRTADNKEVDFVIERGGETVGIEVKLAATLTAADFAGLQLLRQAVGDKKFKLGAVIYTGNEAVAWSEKMWALPVSFLWE